MILKRHMRTAAFCTQHEASCSLCIHTKKHFKKCSKWRLSGSSKLQPCSKPNKQLRSSLSCLPYSIISAASQNSEFFWLLSQLKTPTSQEETHRLSHFSPFQKYRGLHVVLESQGCGSKTDRSGNEALRRPSLWELGRNQQKWATACKKPVKRENREEAHALKRGRIVKKILRKLVSSTCLECCGCIPYLTRFISKGQTSVWTETKGTVLDSFIRFAWDHTTRQESSQMPIL